MENIRSLLLRFGAGPTGAGQPPLIYTRACPTHLDIRTRRSKLTRDPQNITARRRSGYLKPVRCLTSQSVVDRKQRETKQSIPPST